MKDIMTPNPIAIHPDETVEYAAVIMLENRISGLPVVDEENHVVGIITQTDIFKVLINITGIYYGPWQIAFEMGTQPGTISELVKEVREKGGRIISVLTSYEGMEPEKRRVYVRLADMPEEKFKELINELKQKFNLLYWVKDDLSQIPRKGETTKSPEALEALLKI